MIWVKKFGVFILAIILFVAVLLTTYATSLVFSINQPSAVKGWVARSGVYDHVLVAVLNSNEGGGDSSSAISISDPEVQTAAQAAFNSKVIQSGFESFIDSNFNWLSGKSNKPDFRIDLTEPKDEFGNQVQSKVKTFLTNLPVCTPQQTAALQGQLNIKLFKLPCRPANINPDSEATRAKGQVMNSDLLSNPIITASTFSNNDGGSQVYYLKFSKAPSIYREARFVPLLLAAITAAIALLVVVVSTSREKGKKNVAIVLFITSFVLIIEKIAAELIRTSQKVQWFNVDFSKDLNKPLNDLVNIAISSIATINLVIAAILVIIGVLLVRSARKSNVVASKSRPSRAKKNKSKEVVDSSPIYFEDEPVAPKPQPRPAVQPTPQPRPKKPRKPRLIQ